MWNLAVNCPLEDLNSNFPKSEPDPIFEPKKLAAVKIFKTYLESLPETQKGFELSLLKSKLEIALPCDQKYDCKYL